MRTYTIMGYIPINITKEFEGEDQAVQWYEEHFSSVENLKDEELYPIVDEVQDVTE